NAALFRMTIEDPLELADWVQVRWRSGRCPDDRSCELLLAIRIACELAHVIVIRELHRYHARTEVANQRLRSFLTTSIWIQCDVEAFEALELDHVLVPEPVADERDARHSPHTECQEIDWALDHADAARMQHRLFPTEDGFVAGQPQIFRPRPDWFAIGFLEDSADHPYCPTGTEFRKRDASCQDLAALIVDQASPQCGAEW